MTTVKKSLNDLSASKERRNQLKNMKDADIDYSDIPELDQSFWENAEVRIPGEKKAVYIRLDSDVLNWLKSQGKGYQTRINSILRAYYEAHRDKAPRVKR